MSYRVWRLIVAFTVTILAQELVIGIGVAQEPTKSSPPDMTPYARPAMSEDLAPLGRAPIVPPPVPFDVRIVDTVVSNTDSSLTQTDTFNDGETMSHLALEMLTSPGYSLTYLGGEDSVTTCMSPMMTSVVRPDMRVAVARATSFLNFTVDILTGFSTGFVNPGHRLATDPRRGTVYSLFQRRIAPGAGGSQNINYMLNRSTDGGLT